MGAETGYLSSNLSDKDFNYDLVVGTTAEAINATIKSYLFKDATPPTEIWYGQAEAGADIKRMDPIPGVDPFAVPTGEEPPQALLDSDFVFAIKAGFGLPPGVSIRDVPDILILGKDRQKVHYNMFFNTFEICTLDWGRHGSYAWNNYQQPDGAPFIFNYEVDMNFSPTDKDDKFSKLPEDIRKKLQQYNTDIAFSVQQLYLDLNNAGLQAAPRIDGVPSNSPVYVVLQSDFINAYWQDMSNNGQFVLGYAVHGNSQPTNQSSVQPTSLNFMTVPHYDVDGKPSEDHKLYTLNYLMDTNNRPLKVGKPFSWNWVKSDEVSSYHGSMAVRREVFAKFLINTISPSLQYLALTPTNTVNFSVIPGTTISGRLDFTPNQWLDYVETPGAKVATYAFADSVHKNFGIGSKFDLDATASATIEVKGNEVSIELHSNVDIDIVWDLFNAGGIKGRVGGIKGEVVFIVSVAADGSLKFSPKEDYPKLEAIGSDYTKGIAADLDKVGNFGKKMAEAFQSLEVSMENVAGSVETYLNSAGSKWIFPGGQTFLFKDAEFSKHQDLVAHITYAAP